MNALIIDDSPFIRRLIQGVLLGSCNFESVTQRNDGGAGLEELQSNSDHYDIVILDWFMPVKDGIEVLLEIRHAQNMIPIIMCTSDDNKESIINAISAGANEYLKKPFEAAVLEAKVKKVIQIQKDRKKTVNQKRALVVDDSQVIRKLVINTLNENRIFTKIDQAPDGDVALNLTKMNKYDLIILDWEMPHICGIDVLKQIRTIDKTTPIIMATSNTEIDHMVAAFDAGASNFIPKPFTPSMLLDKVHQQIQE